MSVYTIERGGVLVRGIALTNGAIDLGTRWDGKPLTIPLDPRTTVVDGRLVEAPGFGALLLLRDQSGDGGSWHVRAAQPTERWEAMVAAEAIPNALDRILAKERVRARFPHGPPVGWYEFARGQTTTTGERPALALYGYCENDAAFEVRRRGRLDGAPAVFRVACKGGDVTVTVPRTEALERQAVRATW